VIALAEKVVVVEEEVVVVIGTTNVGVEVLALMLQLVKNDHSTPPPTA
jgi:hypothetical protein